MITVCTDPWLGAMKSEEITSKRIRHSTASRIPALLFLPDTAAQGFYKLLNCASQSRLQAIGFTVPSYATISGDVYQQSTQKQCG